MEVHSDIVEPSTPAVSFDNASFWKTDDSGYHTSFTPGSTELETSGFYTRKICVSSQIQVKCYEITPDANTRIYTRRQSISRGYSRPISNPDPLLESPITRRGVKRHIQDDTEFTNISYSTISTPTSVIAGGIQRLKVNDSYSKFDSNSITVSPVSSNYSDTKPSELLHCNEFFPTTVHSFPSTPRKRKCRSSCKLTPFSNNESYRSSPAKSICNFAMHSLSCEDKALQSVLKSTPLNKFKLYEFRPGQKVDIMRMLNQRICCVPAITKIFSYLSFEDLINFREVSKAWYNIYKDYSNEKVMAQFHLKCLHEAKENQENFDLEITSKHKETVETRTTFFREIQNVIDSCAMSNSTKSPPGTPRTMRFKKFTKSASLDSRMQLSCVRCNQPAKVTEDTIDGVWVECTSTTCSFQFCKYCNCDKHPGKRCFQYDLEGPSPSKRKKNSSAIGSKKCRKNLRRLL